MDVVARYRRGARLVLMAVVLGVIGTACSPTGPGPWTYAPATVGPTASGAAVGGGSAVPSGVSIAPTGSADGSGGGSASAAPSAASGSPGPSGLAAAYRFVSAEPCPKSRFTCITLAVPRDHADPTGPTWDVTFAIQRAKKERRGVFVTATGGPGYSGLDAADGYTDAFDEAITDAYDIVFFDQRGVGKSQPLGCPVATATYYRSGADPADPTQRTAVGQAASTYVTDCLKETKVDPADLPFYATSQAIEDLEAFRQYLGVPKLDLYGESYGSQFVQTYATAHPDKVAALFLDGPVDLTVDGIPYYVEAARAFDDALLATLSTCAADRACRSDTSGGPPLAAYDALASKLDQGPITFRFPTAQGTFVDRQLTRADLDNATVNYLYSPYDRSQLERDLSAASAGDYVPLARAAYDSVSVDPETLAARPDPTYSDAMYYAVECQDYAYYPEGADPTSRLNAWLDDGQRLGVNDLRLGATFYGDLPCLYWPSQPTSAARPAPITDPPYPTFVLTATLDTAVPIANAMRLYARLQDAYFIEAIGGAHVIFGRGDACPDEIVTKFLADGTRPAARVLSCPNSVADAYVANAQPAAADYRDALALMSSMDDQIVNTDDYAFRLDEDPITMGCDLGGTLRYEPVDKGTRLVLKDCAFTKGGAMTGSGLIDDDAGTLALTVSVPGGRLRYRRNADDVRSVTGTYRGRSVALKR